MRRLMLRPRRRAVPKALVVASVCAVLVAAQARSQTPDEHAQHHPAPAAAGTTPTEPGAAPATSGMAAAGVGPAPAAGGGMMEQMGEMMKGMGKPPPKELYPSLMALPELSPEQRRQVEQQADERMHAGAMLMGHALDALNTGTQSGDYTAMHEEMTRLREGIAQLESGIAARRALADGRPPREVALAWFKREMTLSIAAVPVAHEWFGVAPFHLFTMALLVAFTLAMLALYFFKMRRAAALFGRIEPDKGSPPPGSSPPTAGGKPPTGGKPASGVKPPAGDKPPTGDEPPAEKDSAPGGSPKGLVSTGNFVPPVSANWRGKLRVGSIVPETPSVKTFRLLPSSGDRVLPFIFVPGQFLNVAFWIGGAKMNRSYSISSSPTQREHVDLTIRREPRGAVSRHIDDLLKVGDEIETGGPVGKFTFSGTEADSIVLISGGVGITPMMSIARYLTEQRWPGDIFFIYTARTPADFIFSNELATLERLNSKLHVEVTISRPEGSDWNGRRGRITKELLTQAVPDLASRRIHVCGPPSMMDSVKAVLTELGVPPEQLKTEAFGAVKPATPATGTTAKATAAATGPRVTFSKNNKSAKIHLDLQQGDSPPKQTILELSEELGIGIEFSCRVGTCGVCKVKKTSGEVEMAVQDALDEDDKANNIILACQAKPVGEVVVEA